MYGITPQPMDVMCLWDALPREIQRVILEFKGQLETRDRFRYSVAPELLEKTRLLRICKHSQLFQCGYYKGSGSDTLWMTTTIFCDTHYVDAICNCYRLSGGQKMLDRWKNLLSLPPL